MRRDFVTRCTYVRWHNGASAEEVKQRLIHEAIGSTSSPHRKHELTMPKIEKLKTTDGDGVLSERNYHCISFEEPDLDVAVEYARDIIYKVQQLGATRHEVLIGGFHNPYSLIQYLCQRMVELENLASEAFIAVKKQRLIFHDREMAHLRFELEMGLGHDRRISEHELPHEKAYREYWERRDAKRLAKKNVTAR